MEHKVHGRGRGLKFGKKTNESPRGHIVFDLIGSGMNYSVPAECGVYSCSCIVYAQPRWDPYGSSAATALFGAAKRPKFAAPFDIQSDTIMMFELVRSRWRADPFQIFR